MERRVEVVEVVEEMEGEEGVEREGIEVVGLKLELEVEERAETIAAVVFDGNAKPVVLVLLAQTGMLIWL